MIPWLSFGTRALTVGIWAAACALVWRSVDRLHWMKGPGSWVTATAFILLTIAVLIVRGTASYKRAQTARSLSQTLVNSIVDLAVLVTSHEKRSLKDEVEAAESHVDAGQHHSQTTGNLYTAASIPLAVNTTPAQGLHRRPYGRDQVISTHLKETMHLLSLFHATSMANLRNEEDFGTFRRHQLPEGDPSGETMAEESGQTGNQTIRRSSQRLPGTSMPYPKPPSAMDMLEVSIMAHWRSAREQGDQDTASWLFGLLVVLPSRCCVEVLSFLQLVPGISEVQQKEIQRICPLSVLLGVSKEEVDDLVTAGEGASRTVQVWLQDALLAPPDEDYFLEPSGAERAHFQQLLSTAASSSNEMRTLMTSRSTVLWSGTAAALVIILSTALPLFIASNVSTSAIAAILSFGITYSFAGAHEAARSHDSPFACHACAQEVAIAQKQHQVNEDVLSVVRADFPGHCMNAAHALCDDLAVRTTQNTSALSLMAGHHTIHHGSAYSEAAMCTTNRNQNNACGSVALSMDVIPEPVSIYMATRGTSTAGNPSNTPRPNAMHAQHAQNHSTPPQALYPSAGGASDTSHTSGGSATSGKSEGRQLSTRISPPPPNAVGGPVSGHMRASSYDTTLAGLESLPSHFSPDAESEDSASSGNTRAAVAALLRRESDESAERTPGRPGGNSMDGHSRDSSRTFSRAFSNLLPALAEDPNANTVLFPDGVDGTVNISVKSTVKSTDQDACVAASRIFNTCKISEDLEEQKVLQKHRTKRNSQEGESDKLPRSDSNANVTVCIDTCTLPISSGFAAFAETPSGTFQNSSARESALTSMDGSLCMGRMHQDLTTDDSDNPLKDAAIGAFLETHDMHDRSRHMRCSSSAGSAVRACSRENSLSRGLSTKGEVVVDMGGSGAIALLPTSNWSSPPHIQSPVLDLNSDVSALQDRMPPCPLTQHSSGSAQTDRLQVSATRCLFGNNSPKTETRNAQASSSKPRRRVAFKSMLFETDSTAMHDSHASSGPWSTGALKLLGSCVNAHEDSPEPETPKNFQSLQSVSAPLGVPDPMHAMHTGPARRAMRRLRPLSLDATPCTSGEEYGTPVSGLINPLCESPRLEASKSNGSVSRDHAVSVDSPSPVIHGPNTPSPSSPPLPPFLRPSLARMSSPDALMRVPNTHASPASTRGAAAVSAVDDVNLRNEKPFGTKLQQSRSLNASNYSATSAEDSGMHVRSVNSDSGTREPSTKEFIEKTMAAFTSGRLGPPSMLSSKHGRRRSTHARHARCSYQVNPETLTPLPRSCSVYSTDPDTDLARLLSPSDSDESRSVAVGSLPSSKGASPNQSPRLSSDTGLQAPVATITSSENPSETKTGSRLRHSGPNSMLTISKARQQPLDADIHALDACVSTRHAFSSAADGPGESCMGLMHGTSSMMYLDESDDPPKRSVRACNFDEGILDGYRGYQHACAPMHAATGTRQREGIAMHDSCEEISEDLPEASECSPENNTGGESPENDTGGESGSETSGGMSSLTGSGTDTANARSSCIIMSPDNGVIMTGRKACDTHALLQPSKAACPKLARKGEEDPNTAELFEISDGQEITSSSFCAPADESSCSVNIPEGTMHEVDALDSPKLEGAAMTHTDDAMSMDNENIPEGSTNRRTSSSSSSGDQRNESGDSGPPNRVLGANSLSSPSTSLVDSSDNTTSEELGNAVECTSEQANCATGEVQRTASGSRTAQLSPGQQWLWCTDASKVAWGSSGDFNVDEPGSMEASEHIVAPHRKCSSAAARIQEQLDNFTKSNENSIMSSGSFQPVYEWSETCGDRLCVLGDNTSSAELANMDQEDGYLNECSKVVPNGTLDVTYADSNVQELTSRDYTEYDPNTCSTMHGVDGRYAALMHEKDSSDQSCMLSGHARHALSAACTQKHERAASVANVLEASKLLRRRDQTKLGGVSDDSEGDLKGT